MSGLAFFVGWVARNLLRHRLRSALTLAGIMIAIVAFGLLRTVVDAWYAGAEATSAKRLITRNAISLVFPLPISYLQRIRQIAGVATVSYANWFAGIYIDAKNFFPQFAIEPKSYLALYPEFVLPPEALSAFLKDQGGAVVGRRVAEQYGWKVGDVVPLRGTIYPGEWRFVLRGIYTGAEPKIDETNLFFHWNYLNEEQKKQPGGRQDHAGIYVIGLHRAAEAARVSRDIDALFKNSMAETLTETEKAFQLGFVAMTEAILVVVQIVSLFVIAIILAVAANTMTMAVRERRSEYATLQALGFGSKHVLGLIVGESVFLSCSGGLLGIALTFPVAEAFAARVGTLFPIFTVSTTTIALAFGAAGLVGLAAGLFAALGAKESIASALRDAP
ncbi:MAG: ABC transporter permease [Chromatiales bacterium]